MVPARVRSDAHRDRFADGAYEIDALDLVGVTVIAVVLVGVGGTAGVLARYGLTVWIQSIWTIAAINLAGSFLLGLLLHVGAGWSHDVRNGVGVGFLGGFTTLSTLTAQTVLEADGGRAGLAAAYFAVNVVGGLLAAFAGYALGRVMA
jgi:fluoride exporter